jgi:hypothetical protein
MTWGRMLEHESYLRKKEETMKRQERFFDMDTMVALENAITIFLSGIRFQIELLADLGKKRWDMSLKLTKVKNSPNFTLVLNVVGKDKDTGKFKKNMGGHTFVGDRNDLEYICQRFRQVSIFTEYKGYSFEVMESTRRIIITFLKN